MAEEVTAMPGLIKVKLLHGDGGTVLLPELIVLGDALDHWVQPQFFFAPLLYWDDDNAGTIINIAAVDKTRRFSDGLDATVTFSRADWLCNAGDRSEIYSCSVESEYRAAALAVGRARQNPDGNIDIRLYHHTTETALEQIQSSGHVRGSAWNFQGTRELTNVAYAYFTSMPKISSERDLLSMAMASNGQLGLRLDQNGGDAPDVVLDVYRSSTRDRTATLPLWVPAAAISSPHIWMHVSTSVCYEIVHPWIHRVGLRPGEGLTFVDGDATPSDDTLRRFDYAVLGDCTMVAGLGAPYDEEETTETFRVADLGALTLFDYWAANQNTALYAPPEDTQAFRSDQPPP